MIKFRGACTIAALSIMASGSAYADATANVGIMSDYIFRGVYQAEASAFGGIDVTTDSGFYVGTWGANLKDGLEYDIYFGYEGGGEDFTWYSGFTGYFYTDDFDNTYKELNLGFSIGFLSVDYALGDYENTAAKLMGGKDEQTYEYIGATFSPEVGPYYFFGRTDYKSVGRNVYGPGDAGRIPGTGSAGYWFEVGKSFELMDDLELNVAALYSGDVQQFDPVLGTCNQDCQTSVQLGPSSSPDSEYAFVLTLTKNISIRD